MFQHYCQLKQLIICLAILAVAELLDVRQSVTKMVASHFKKKVEEKEKKTIFIPIKKANNNSTARTASRSNTTAPVDSCATFKECFDQVIGYLKGGGSNSKNNKTAFCSAPCVKNIRDRFAVGPLTSLLLNKNETSLSTTSKSGARDKKKILINSPGGVGSTYFVDCIERHLHLSTNDRGDRDALKHITVDRLDLLNEGFHVTIHQICIEKMQEACPIQAVDPAWQTRLIYQNAIQPQYHRVLYVVNDPVHAIFSIYRRNWEHLHQPKLCGECSFPSAWRRNATAVFEASAAVGYDVWGIAKQAQQWMNVQNQVHFARPQQQQPPDNTSNSNTKDNNSMAELVPKSDYLQRVFQNGSVVPEQVQRFPPIMIVDIQTAQAAPDVLAAFLDAPAKSVQDYFRDK